MNVANKTASIIQLALSTTIIIPSKLKKLTHQRDNALNKTQFETIIEHLLTYLLTLSLYYFLVLLFSNYSTYVFNILCMFVCILCIFVFYVVYSVFLYCFVYCSSSVYSCLFTTFYRSKPTTATGWKTKLQ